MSPNTQELEDERIEETHEVQREHSAFQSLQNFLGITPVAHWAKAERSHDWHKDDREQAAIQILQSYLGDSIIAEEAASRLTALYDPAIKRDIKNYDVYDLWGIVCSAIRSLGADKDIRERIISLLEEISNLQIHHDDGEPVVDGERVYWTTLPYFPMIFKEYAMSLEELEEEADEKWHAQRSPLLNATSFAATCLSRGSIGMEFYSLGALRDGVEAPLQTLAEKSEANMFIPLAATWILLAGGTFYKLCQDGYQRADQSSGTSLYLWQGDSGYTLERWAFWKERFREISTMEDLHSSVRVIAADAAEEMEVIERDALAETEPRPPVHTRNHGKFWSLLHHGSKTQ